MVSMVRVEEHIEDRLDKSAACDVGRDLLTTYHDGGKDLLAWACKGSQLHSQLTRHTVWQKVPKDLQPVVLTSNSPL